MQNKICIIIFSMVILLLTPYAVISNPILDSIRLEPLSDIVKYKKIISNLKVDDMIELSLILSGTPINRLESYIGKTKNIIKNFKEEQKNIIDHKTLSENALGFLHKNTLKKYHTKQTRLDNLLDTGVFNCVSSAVLYMILLSSLDIEVQGVKTKDHAFCLVELDGAAYDVETTNLYGFDPGSKKEFVDEFGDITGFNYVPPGNYGKRNNIDKSQLISLILHNRITDLYDERNYLDAMGLAVDLDYLLQNKESYTTLIGAIQNLGAYINNHNLHESGAEAFKHIYSVYSKDEKILKVYQSLIHNHIVKIMDKRNYQKALKLSREYYDQNILYEKDYKDFIVIIYTNQANLIASKSYSEAIKLIETGLIEIGYEKRLVDAKMSFFNNYVVDLLKKKKIQEVDELIEVNYKEGFLTQKDYNKFKAYVYLEQGSAMVKEKGYLQGVKFLRSALEHIGPNQGISTNIRIYLRNFEVTIHNKAVSLYQENKIQEAVELLENAILDYPESRQIKNDLNKMRKYL